MRMRLPAYTAADMVMPEIYAHRLARLSIQRVARAPIAGLTDAVAVAP
ncbi:hypothetical protein HMPREF0591_1746 [Mycobacterium parascrofulaceum ATCC BAA-614]|uniref:Uncharacterized protein n=1 Tax=Mycobacterium parascrofulaceum ATCC BAA-614 TaxID=525368 RepID=D5P6F2_9MYCO|nr:hypothetical protein HMPREF0591_1746 [Mycobacterium parascrofulaceum ATCC BAA-614]